MKRLLTAGLPVLLLIVPGCRSKAGAGPEWLQAAPPECQVAFSAEARWILEHRGFQSLLAKSPMVEQALDLFLTKAKIAPHLETGRITFFVMQVPKVERPDPAEISRAFLIRLSGFKNPRSLGLALAESFPQEGSLVVGGKDLALHVIVDVNQIHMRAMAEPGGSIWIGDLGALAALSAGGGPQPKSAIRRAGEWVDPKASFQGFMFPDRLLANLPTDKLPAEWAAELPRGLEALTWSVQPAQDPQGAHRLELAVAGSAEGVSRTVPWLQRLVAVSNSLQPPPNQPSEMIQEKDRAGIRCSLTQEQLNSLMTKLGQPLIRLDSGKAGRKA
jgi:hypothetical protein